MPKLSKQEFYDKYYPIVADSVKGTGLHPEAVIAQMGIESGWGGSGLTTKHNNFFGIKGKGVNMPTEEEVNGKRVKQNSNFRTYNSAEDSVKDYVDLLKNNKRYANVLKAKTPEAQAEAMGKSGYSTSSTYGSAIKSTIKASKKNIPQKYRDMPKNEKQSKLDKLKSNYQETKKDIEIYEVLNKNPNKDSQEYKDYLEKKKTLNKQALSIVHVTENRKADEIKSRLDEAKESRDIDALREIKKESDAFEESRFDFGTKDGETIVDREKDYSGDEVAYGKFVASADFDWDKLGTMADDIVTKEPVQSETETEAPATTEIDLEKENGGGGSGTKTEREVIPDVDDSAETNVTKDADGNIITKPTTDYQAEYDKAIKDKEDYDTYKRSQEQYEHEASKVDKDNFGALLDTGRLLMGADALLNTDLPEYSTGDAYNEAMGDATRMKDQGLSPDELAYRERQDEEAYAYDVKNIKRLAGGSAGVALGNLGRAQSQFYDSKGATAALDEGVRRDNQRNFQQMALQDERINRMQYQDDFNNASNVLQSGSALVADAIGNMKERSDYNKQYGEGSVWYNYQEELRKDMGESRVNRKNAANNQIFKAEQLINQNVADKEAALLKSKEITGDGSSVARELEKQQIQQTQENSGKTYQPDADGKLKATGGTFTSTSTDADVPTPKKSIFKKKQSKQDIADDLTRRMDEMDPDDDEFMKLSAQLDKLKL